MRAVVTGAAGFIGSALVRALRARDDQVVALLRSASTAPATRLAELGAQLVEVDLARSGAAELVPHLSGADAVFHLAGVYRVGIPASEHAAMYAANVAATEAVLDAAIAAGVPRILHASTGNVYGNTRGRVVDETYRRPQPPRFLSYYDETKYRAHLAAEERVAAGAPILLAMVGQVYGPGDHSQVGTLLSQAMAGRLPVVSAPELGLSLVHVDDVAIGMLLVMDRGALGSGYNLGGEIATLGEVVERAARIADRRPPVVRLPGWVAWTAVPFAPAMWRLFAQQPNLAELVRASAGVTYWISDAKARAELGYRPRDLETGLPTLLPGGTDR